MTPRPIVTLTTDFGEGSPYVAQMKGILLGIQPELTIVDVTHGVPPQDIACGARVLADVCHRFPAQAIHVVVVDPGVGTARDILAFRSQIGTFVGPDNGVFGLVADRWPPSKVVRLTNPDYWLSPLSSTFHGRDIMAPVAARIATGVAFEELGELTTSICRFTEAAVEHSERQLVGQIVMVDSFGNLLTNLTAKDLPAEVAGQSIRVQCGDQVVEGVSTTYGDSPPGTTIALYGSNGSLELAVVNGNAAEQLGYRSGDKVTVTW